MELWRDRVVDRADAKADEVDCFPDGKRLKSITLKMPSFVVMWIWLCAYQNAAGWTLSALNQLNKPGYAAAGIIGLGIWLCWRQKTGAPWLPKIHASKLKRRFCRGFPLAFLILTGLAFLGGALHDACNYDAMAYRTPRVLYWLDAQQWQWIHTDFPRLNTRTAGFEWLTAPQFLFLRTDRLLFLLNVIAFLLLPGRVFAVLTRLGVRPRAAWHWMWLFPSGYGYVLQAGSVVNDMFGTLMALAAFEFALRAGREQRATLLWTSMLAAALMTAVKAFNMVLLLPWGITALAAAPLLLRRPIATFAVMLMAAGASMVPTSILDAHYCHDWTGANIENTPIGGGQERLRAPVTGINLALGNLVPPIFPFAGQWEAFVQRVLPETFKASLKGNFEPALTRFKLPELQVEESSGLGCGLTVLLLVLLVKKIRYHELVPKKWFAPATLVPLGAWAGVGVFLLRVGIAGPARYLLPFYLLLAAPIMAGAVAGRLFQARAWRGAAYVLFAMAGLLLVLSPQRPLWPSATILSALDAEHSENHLLNRMWRVYSVYGARGESFAPVLAVLPPDAGPLGLVAFDAPEAALWRPFGSRRISHITRDDTPEKIRGRGIKYALVSEAVLAQHSDMDAAGWLAHFGAEKMAEFKLRIHAGQEPEGWFLARFQ